MNAAIVVLDSLRKDRFDDAFGWLPGRRFERAYSTSHWTIPAHASLYTGFYPSEVGVHAKSHELDCDRPTLAERLSAAGYRTRLWTAQPQIYVWDGWTRGFDESVGPATLHPAADGAFDWTAFQAGTDAAGMELYLRGVWECLRSDRPTARSLQAGVRRLRRSPADGGAAAALERARATEFGDRELLVVNLMDAHIPYRPPDGASDPVSVTSGDGFAGDVADPEHVRAAYDASVAHLSAVYRELFAELRREFDLVVTLSDHGELLGEGGDWNHGYGLAPELTHVPLVVSGDGIPDGTCEATVSLLDVHRTVAEATGVETDGRGVDLLAEPTSRDRLVEYHGFVPWMRDQFERKPGLPEGFFDDRDAPLGGFATADGGYVHGTHDDGFRQVGTDISDPAARLAALREPLDEKPLVEGRSDVSAGVREQLADLGYA